MPPPDCPRFRAMANCPHLKADFSPGGAMPNLHPQIQTVLEAMARLNLRAIEDMTPAEARAQMEAMAASPKAEPLPTARIENRTVPGPAGQIPVRIYWPNAAGIRPAIVYY